MKAKLSVIFNTNIVIVDVQFKHFKDNESVCDDNMRYATRKQYLSEFGLNS